MLDVRGPENFADENDVSDELNALLIMRKFSKRTPVLNNMETKSLRYNLNEVPSFNQHEEGQCN